MNIHRLFAAAALCALATVADVVPLQTLNRAFVRISDAKIRRKIIDLVKAIAADDEA